MYSVLWTLILCSLSYSPYFWHPHFFFLIRYKTESGFFYWAYFPSPIHFSTECYIALKFHEPNKFNPSLLNSTSGKTVVYQHHVARVSSGMQCEWASVLVLLNALFFLGVSWAQIPFLSVFWSSTLSTEVLFRADLQLLIKILTAVSILCFGGGSPTCVTVSLLSLNRYIKYQFWVM